MLDPNTIFLNHGAFGACPIPVLDHQQMLRSQLERDPVRFFVQDFEPLLDAARQVLADFVGAASESLVFVPNATTGVNTVLRSLPFQPGDDVLVTNHEYNACRNALNAVAEATQIRLVEVTIPFPLHHPETITEQILAHVSDRTRLLLIDHVTSPTGFIMPLQDVIPRLNALGIDTLVDGAHAPGMVPLDMAALGVAYYTGNCHKWLCAPKGAAFLYIRNDRQMGMRPLVISHGANCLRSDRSRLQLEFDWVGTSDPTAVLCVPLAIQMMGSLLPGGWPELMQRNHEMAIAARQTLCDRLELEPPVPADRLGSLATVILPDGSVDALQQALWHQGFQVPVSPWNDISRTLRISAQIYNTLAEYDQLAQAIGEFLATEA
jgi:isopenicillin-N epimerase